jgi:hypothetical protein
MTHAAIRPDFNQALNAHLNFAAQVTFHLVVLTNELADRSHIGLRKVLYPDIRIDLGVGQNFLSASRSYPIEIGQANFDPLIAGQINTFNSRHSLSIPVAVYALDFRRLQIRCPCA